MSKKEDRTKRGKLLKEKLYTVLNKKGMTFEELAEAVGQNSNSLHDKFARGSLRYFEVEDILRTLGYSVVWLEDEQR